MWPFNIVTKLSGNEKNDFSGSARKYMRSYARLWHNTPRVNPVKLMKVSAPLSLGT